LLLDTELEPPVFPGSELAPPLDTELEPPVLPGTELEPPEARGVDTPPLPPRAGWSLLELVQPANKATVNAQIRSRSRIPR
jgi:hypothetical protein